jgi:hypothetical protein
MGSNVPVEGDIISNADGSPAGYVNEVGAALPDGQSFNVNLRTTKQKQPGTGYRDVVVQAKDSGLTLV